MTLSRIAGGVVSAAATSAAHLVSLLLKLFPLIGSQNLLQTFVSLASDFRNARLRLFSKSLQLLSGVSKYLIDLCFLFGVELKVINHTVEPSPPIVASVPSPVSVQCQSAGRKAEHENTNCGQTNLPFAFGSDVHTLPS
jgi:hypothetical protein